MEGRFAGQHLIENDADGIQVPAVVLVFVNQSTTSKQNPDGSFAASAVKVGLKKINGAWLISSFDPV